MCCKLDYSEEEVHRVTSLSFSDMAITRGRHRSRCLETDPDAVDDHNFLRALLCSACSTTRCCNAVWTVVLNCDFFRPSCQNSICMSRLGISRHTGFSLEFPSPREIAGQGLGLNPPFLGFFRDLQTPRWTATQGFEFHMPS